MEKIFFIDSGKNKVMKEINKGVLAPQLLHKKHPIQNEKGLSPVQYRT